MKAFRRGNKIVFSRNEDYKEIEQTVQALSRDFERLKSICEDRTTEAFPVEVVRRIIEKGSNLKGMGMDIEIPEDYMKFMVEEKDVLRYFEGVINKADEEMRKYEKKTRHLREFAEMLDR